MTGASRPVLVDTVSVLIDWLRLTSQVSKRDIVCTGAIPKLALLSWAMPPSTNAGVYRPLSFIRFAPKDRWRVHSIHWHYSSKPTDAGIELDSLWPPEVARTRVSASNRKPSWRLLPQVDGDFASAIDIAKSAIDAMRTDPPEVVLASGPPFCVFIAGIFVANHFNAKLVLDYRDEWTECPFDFVSRSRDNLRWEQKCLQRADAVVFTTESHRLHQISKFPMLDPTRTHLIPNGWDSSIKAVSDPATLPVPKIEDSRIRVSHVGNLAEHTPPDEVLEIVSRLVEADPQWLERIELLFVGGCSKAAQERLSKFPHSQLIRLTGHVPKSQADKFMRDADILLLIASRDLERYLPGKLFEYVAARRPILVVGHPGESSRLVESLGAGELLAPTSAASQIEITLSRLLQSERSSTPTVERWLAKHDRAQLAGRLFDLLDELIQDVRSHRV